MDLPPFHGSYLILTFTRGLVLWLVAYAPSWLQVRYILDYFGVFGAAMRMCVEMVGSFER
jgi:hypothetical protein